MPVPPLFRSRPVLWMLPASLLSSLFLVLIFPKFDLQFLAPIALSPLLYVVAQVRRGMHRFLYGWAAGIVYWFFICGWIAFVLQAHGGMGRWGGWASFLLFCVLKALHLGVFGWLAGPLMHRPWAIAGVAALWTGLERTHGTFGFAWLDLGNAGINMSVPLRAAPFVGVYGVSFVFAMMAAAVSCILLRQQRTRLLPLAALALLWLLPAIPEHLAAADQVLVVQPNIDADVDWNPMLQDRVEERLLLLSNALPAPLVVWPELPAPLYFYDDRQFQACARDIASRHSAFLFETVAYTGQHEPLNSAVMLGANGAEIGRYDQIDLVPFGEYVPPLFSWVNRITHETSDFVPGHDVRVFPALGHRYGTYICYESAFPDLVRQFAKQGADVFVNLSNDGYFGNTEAPLQHLALERMRAVENRRFVIRATNDGVTAIIQPSGELLSVIRPKVEAAQIMNYGAVEDSTFYARHGDWFAWLCLAVGLGLAIEAMRSGVSKRTAN